MLIEFRVENFKSFKGEQVLSMVASGSDKSLPDNCVKFGKLSLLKAVGLYGANASGKSNLLNALSVMRTLIKYSDEKGVESYSDIVPFRLDESMEAKPTSFEITFIVDDIRYQYGFKVRRECVLGEWLIAYPSGKPRLWFEREHLSNQTTDSYKWGSTFRGSKKKLSEMTTDNSLFLSVAARWNHPQVSHVYKWFENSLRVLRTGVSLPQVTASLLHQVKNSDEELRDLPKHITGLLQKADLGIHGLSVELRKSEDMASLYPSLSGVPEPSRRELLENLREHSPYVVRFVHRTDSDTNQMTLEMKDESDGTRRFFELLGPWLETMAFGYTVAIDEIESSLHPLLTRELVRLILREKLDKAQPQLIFATHDVTLLDPDLLRRDQVYFVEKDGSGASQLYSLADYKKHRPRKGEAMQNGYLSGRYGAIPVLRAFGLE